MKFPSSFLEELRSRVAVSKIVGAKVQLKSKGREFSGLCPFHKEKTPSFTVNDEKGFYHCFGCGAHGDAVKFLTETKGLQYKEAIEELASIAGMQVPILSPDYQRKEQKRLELQDVLQLAANWFEEQLYQDRGKGALVYLQNRRLRPDVISKFKLGFATNNKKDIYNFLKSKDVEEKLIIESGLARKNDRGDVYDYFRNRVIFPIFNIKNQVIAFGGRTLGDVQPKYLNSPETELFKKGNILFNENNARALAYKTSKLVVVEGYMDAIALYNAGVRTAVAPLGTALTQTQIKRLWSMVKEPVLCFDGDNAGIKASYRAANIAFEMLEPGYSLKFALLKDGNDPDDIINNEGVSSLKKILQNATNLSDFVFKFEKEKIKDKNPESLSLLENDLNKMCEAIQNPTVKSYYLRFFKNQLWEFTKIKKFAKPILEPVNQDSQNYDTVTRLGQQKVIMVTIVKYPELLKHDKIYEDFCNIEFVEEINEILRTDIVSVFEDNNDINHKNLLEELENKQIKHYIEELLLLKPHSLLDFEKKDTDKLTLWEIRINELTLANLKNERDILNNSGKAFEEYPKYEEIVKQVSILEEKLNQQSE